MKYLLALALSGFSALLPTVEQFPDGSPLWRDHAVGLRSASLKLQEIAKHTQNECFAVHLLSGDVVTRANLRGGKPVVFQVSYDSALSAGRASVLRLHGYQVVSVLGNDAAKLVLDNPQKCDFFIVGCGAPDDIRNEIVAWIKAKYPKQPMPALNAPGKALDGADFNVKINGPESWLPLLANVVGGGTKPPQSPDL